MDYLLLKLWPYLLLVFVMGLAWGYHTCPGTQEQPGNDLDHRPSKI